MTAPLQNCRSGPAATGARTRRKATPFMTRAKASQGSVEPAAVADSAALKGRQRTVRKPLALFQVAVERISIGAKPGLPFVGVHAKILAGTFTQLRQRLVRREKNSTITF